MAEVPPQWFGNLDCLKIHGDGPSHHVFTLCHCIVKLHYSGALAKNNNILRGFDSSSKLFGSKFYVKQHSQKRNIHHSLFDQNLSNFNSIEFMDTYFI